MSLLHHPTGSLHLGHQIKEMKDVSLSWIYPKFPTREVKEKVRLTLLEFKFVFVDLQLWVGMVGWGHRNLFQMQVHELMPG